MCQEVVLRFGWSDAQIPTHARQACLGQLASVLPATKEAEQVCHTVGLVISELVSNAVKASESGVVVTCTVHRDHVRVTVSDDSAALPQVQRARPTDVHGRGLRIVQVLSSSWGVDVTSPGKQVWALVPFPGDVTAAVRCALDQPGAQAAAAPADTGTEPGVQRPWPPDGAGQVDGDIARLPADSVLIELLERVRTILSADTAAVLVRDGDSDELVAYAACGLEEEVRQGFRLAIGRGFAGGVAATGHARTIEHVDPSTVVNPVLWRKGVRTMLGVPLFGSGGLLGVLHVGRLTERHFTAGDSEVLQTAAMRIATALQSRRLVVETAAATLLERSLLPTRMPKIAGVEFAARYVAAESQVVGGDWYDAFTLPSGDLCLVVGDVAGHGLNAAVVMGRLKSALRAYTLIADTPERMVELADHKMQHFEFGTIVTLICGIAKPPFDRITFCSAGHPPPVLAAPGQDPQLVELPTGPPLGVAAGVRRASATVDLPAGSSLVLYTDGLVERRRESITGRIELLRGAVPAEPAETVCDTVMHELVGTTTTTDDIALLAMHRMAHDYQPAS